MRSDVEVKEIVSESRDSDGVGGDAVRLERLRLGSAGLAATGVEKSQGISHFRSRVSGFYESSRRPKTEDESKSSPEADNFDQRNRIQ